MKFRLGVLICLLLLTHRLHAQDAPIGRQETVIFTDYPALASPTEISRRGQSPLTSDALLGGIARNHQRVAEQYLNPSEERYTLYVPPTMPPDGYALLVFIPPWDNAWLPPGWDNILDMFGVIFVAAARSDNDKPIFMRRIPLALIAAEGVQKRYRVNPAKIFIGGMSGGGRAAERAALAYPDLFRGAYLAAGSDNIGEAELSIPSRELFEHFQADNRVVFSTGEEDKVNLTLDKHVESSFDDYCVFNHTAQIVPGIAHNVPTAKGLKAALKWLLAPQSIDPAKLESCRARLESEVEAALDHVRALKAKGDVAGARVALKKLDARYSGLAGPDSVELAHALE
jgi:predicted esterase